MTAVSRIEELGPAVFTGRDIRRHRLVRPRLAAALLDLEGLGAGRLDRLLFDPVDTCQWGSVRSQPLAEALEPRSRPLYLDLDAGRGIANPSGELELLGKAEDKWPESYPLYDAAY